MYLAPSICSIALLSIGISNAQDEGAENPSKSSTVNKQDVFRKDKKSTIETDQTHFEIGVLVEYISVDHLKANELLQKFGSHPNQVQELRDQLEVMLDSEEATLIETSWVRGQNGSRSLSESIREYIYPTEFDPPEIPNYTGNSNQPQNEESKYGGVHLTSSTPAAFQTRNTGTSLEIDCIISMNGKEISVNVAPELDTRLEDRYYMRRGFEETAKGIEHIANPTFYTMKDTTMLTVTPGNYNLLGVHKPHDKPEQRVFSLLRADLIPVN